MAALFSGLKKTQYKSEGLSGWRAPAYRCRGCGGPGAGAVWTHSPPTRYNLAVFFGLRGDR
ncbi:hypothetical protein BVIET440_140095 [Burkholderia vietnamiensis]